MQQPDLFVQPGPKKVYDGKAARDEGIAKTTIKNREWMDWAFSMMGQMKLEGYTTVTGEQIRFWLESLGNAKHPSSPHAWGALTSHLVKAGILRDTGRVLHMKAIKSHARRTPLWEFV